MKNQDGESKTVLPPASPLKISSSLGTEDSDLAESPLTTMRSNLQHPEMCSSELLVDGNIDISVNEEQGKKEGMCFQGSCWPYSNFILISTSLCHRFFCLSIFSFVYCLLTLEGFPR